jgi:hypothetical protein
MAESIFTPNERKAITALARRRGFKSLKEYMRSLVEVDAEKHGDPAPLEDNELGDPTESFRRAWADAMEGRTMTLKEFRRAMEEDDD